MLQRMIRIGLISDTHVPDVASGVPEQVRAAFNGVDLILHAGDVYLTSVLDELEELAPVLAAEGDDDAEEIWHDRRVKPKQVLTLDGITLWLSHVRPWSWPRNVKPPDIIVHGHTHIPAVLSYEGILVINPGSATFPRYKYELGTVGVLTIGGYQPEVTIVDLRAG